jgi:hypothetical protein
MKDLTIVPDGRTALNTYRSVVVGAVSAYTPKLNEAVLAGQAFDDNDMTELAKIDPIIAGYQSMVSALLKVPVPQSLAKYHLDLLNGAMISLYNAQSFRHMDTDPVRGLSAVSFELVALQNMSDAISGIRSYFSTVGMTFGA